MNPTTLPISADELAECCITSFDRLPPIPVDDDEEYRELTEQHYYQSELLRRLKVKLVNLYRSVLEEAYEAALVTTLMEHVLTELEDLMGRNHPRGRCPLIDMVDVIESTRTGVWEGGSAPLPHVGPAIDMLLNSSPVGPFLEVRACRRVGVAPEDAAVERHDTFAYGGRLTVRRIAAESISQYLW